MEDLAVEGWLFRCSVDVSYHLHSGFGGKGFKFIEEEGLKELRKKKRQRRRERKEYGGEELQYTDTSEDSDDVRAREVGGSLVF